MAGQPQAVWEGPEAMKIAIVGTGAMGSVYAGLMASAGHEVWAIDTWADHVAAMARDGLRLEGASGDRRVALHATMDAAECGPCDLVIVGTKAMHVEAAARAALPLLGPDTPVISIQNGIGGPDMAAAVMGAERVLVGVVGGFGASMVGPGHAHHNAMELMRLGERAGGITPRLERIAEIWRGAGFTVRCFEDIDQLVWEKLLCNCCYSGTSAITGLTVGGIIDSPGAWAVASGCAAEVHAVAKARGITLEMDDPREYARAFGDKIRPAKPSMLQDIEAGRVCEVDCINGAIPALAEACGLEAPINRTVADLVRGRMAALGLQV